MGAFKAPKLKYCLLYPNPKVLLKARIALKIKISSSYIAHQTLLLLLKINVRLRPQYAVLGTTIMPFEVRNVLMNDIRIFDTKKNIVSLRIKLNLLFNLAFRRWREEFCHCRNRRGRIVTAT